MINNNPGGRLWVDPDGVEGLGKAYDSHVGLYETYLAQLTALRARYANAWGDDDMGKQFSTKFLEGMDNLESIIGGVKGTLNYTAQGLQESSRAYREADEAAAEVSRKMAKDFDGLERPVYRSASATEGRTTTPTTESLVRGELRPAKMARTRAEHRAVAQESVSVARPAERLAVESVMPGVPTEHRAVRTVDEHEAGLLEPARLTRTAVVGRATPMRPLLPTEPDGEQPLRARAPAMPAMRAMPAISSYLARPEYTTAYVGGQALPPEYRLISLNPFEDGSTRVDANLYDSITPLAGTPVTAPDGTPLDPGTGQFFVVKENPGVDPTVPGYQPLVLSYAPDGTPTPIIPGA